MLRSKLTLAVRLGVVVAAILFPRTGFAQSIWVPTDLGTLGGLYSSAADINATAQVVGESDTRSGFRHAFIWTTAGDMVDLGTLGGPTSSALAINDAGQVLGSSKTADGTTHGFLWSAVSGMVDLGDVITSSFTDINNAGEIVGSSGGHAVLRTPAGAMIDLGTLGGTWSRATAINDVGQVVGTSAIADGTEHAFMWTAAGGMVQLASLHPMQPSLAAINDAGQVVGTFLYSVIGATVVHAFSWTAAGGMIDLRCGRSRGARADTGSVAYEILSSRAYDVNAVGQVVGSTGECGGGPIHAFIWTAAAGMVSLGSAPFNPSSASGINDAGQIVGSSTSTGGTTHAVLWQLVPQPPLAVTALAPNAAFPVPAGTPVTWTAAATDGIAPYTYQYWVFDGITWTLGRDWSASANWTWEPPLPGTYIVQVWARNKGSSADYDAWRGASATISMPSVLTITTVTPSAASLSAGTVVTWTATAAGGSGPYTYRFVVYDGATWTVGQEWSVANTWNWIPPKPGTYAFQVWVRDADSVSEYDAWRAFGPYTATPPASLTITAFESDRAFPLPVATPVTWTATVAGDTTGQVFYQFHLFDGSTWSIGQDWSLSNSWTWLPTAAGNYAVQVWARNGGSVAPFDTWRGHLAIVTSPTELQVSQLRVDRTFPVPAGTPVIWTARGVGGIGPYTYEFLVFDGATWRIGQNWSVSSSWTWVPPSAGNYFVQAWMRNAGSLSAYDAWAGTSALGVSSPTALAVTVLTVAPMAPLFAHEAATLTATAIGGTGPYAYQFWVYDGSTWTIGQAWSGSNTFTWRPQWVGTYWIQAWVRNAFATSPYDAWTGLGPLIVLQ